MKIVKKDFCPAVFGSQECVYMYEALYIHFEIHSQHNFVGDSFLHRLSSFIRIRLIVEILWKITNLSINKSETGFPNE